MANAQLQAEIERRRVLAIISHPDAGKTTVTEKLLLLGKLIQVAGTVKARKSDRHARSDWMTMEQERGISVTSSVMQFPWQGHVVNLLDTPGHEDFSEDTYRVLTAVDSALMVVDGARGVEARTVKLMEICRLRDTPVFTFVNKLDRDIRDPVELLDDIETVLKMRCAPINWPLGMGKAFKGIYHLASDRIAVYRPGQGHRVWAPQQIQGLASAAAADLLGEYHADYREQIELVRGASHGFDPAAYLRGELTPVYFGTALGNFGVCELLNDFVTWAPAPRSRQTETRTVDAREDRFTGFVFKIQANMDARHRDRIAFMRVCSGQYRQGMRMRHCRIGKDIKVADAVSFLAGDRARTGQALSGDIIGLHNHGTIRIGDTFTSGEQLKFRGIPHFAPELFRRIRLQDPLQLKPLQKGLTQLSEEGSTQVFRPLCSNEWIIGAVGGLQFEVVAYRLRDEYKVDCIYQPVSIHGARWVESADPAKLAEFRHKAQQHLAIDSGGYLTYLAPTRVNLKLVQERWPELVFHSTREH